MSVRDRTAADLPCLVDMLRRVHEADGYPTVWPGDAIRWLTGSGTYGAWVADQNGTVAGHVGLSRASAQPTSQAWARATQRPGEQLAEVTRLFSAPEARGTGIGRQLLQRAAAAAHHLGLWPVLEVRHDGRPGACRLYDAAGWHLAGTVQRRLTAEIVLPFDCWIGPEPGV